MARDPKSEPDIPGCGRCGFPFDLMSTRAHDEVHRSIDLAQRKAKRARTVLDREGWLHMVKHLSGRFR